MRKFVEAKKESVTEEKIQFAIEELEPFESLEAAGQMITDTDHNAFVYLLDTGNEFIYVQFAEETWPFLAQALEREDVPLLSWGQQVLPLDSFHEEMWMLIDNIEGNDNYGEAFHLAVEKAFHEALASRA
ncbi:hypothetical protein [Planococcus salinus]|uniref:Uncharacterized protein n=1 Tax=Planococcus salinus TaxID=1848460 RepID=A0A3M8P481_9BACL|nr:hypothetical protein [Planococcus salinus]RNF38483.1 hypothetical protein EEX84_14190 [Planococcus salinus]